MVNVKIGNFEWGLWYKGIYVILGKIRNLENLEVLQKKSSQGHFGNFDKKGHFCNFDERGKLVFLLKKGILVIVQRKWILTSLLELWNFLEN